MGVLKTNKKVEIINLVLNQIAYKLRKRGGGGLNISISLFVIQCFMIVRLKKMQTLKIIIKFAQKYVITLNTSHGSYFQPSAFLTDS